MRRLYEQAKLDQWNAATDIDWSRPLDGDGGLIADDLVDIHGTKFWDRLSAAERVEVNRAVARWRLSTLVPGEHGAMLLCSQRARCPGPRRQALPVHPGRRRGRHNEVLHRYIDLRLAGDYPLAGNVEEISTPCSAPGPGISRQSACNLSPRLSPSPSFACWGNRRRTPSCARSVAASCRTRRAIWGSACCRAGVVAQATPRNTARWRISRYGRVPHAARHLPARGLPGEGFGHAEVEEIRKFRRESAAGGDETAFRKYSAATCITGWCAISARSGC